MNESPMPLASSHVDLQAVARQVMIGARLQSRFPAAGTAGIRRPQIHPNLGQHRAHIRDLRGLFWSSIDNDTSETSTSSRSPNNCPDGDIRVLDRPSPTWTLTFLESQCQSISTPPRQTTTRLHGRSQFFHDPEALSTGLTSPARESGQRRHHHRISLSAATASQVKRSRTGHWCETGHN